jgi:hypothetical protein
MNYSQNNLPLDVMWFYSIFISYFLTNDLFMYYYYWYLFYYFVLNKNK